MENSRWNLISAPLPQFSEHPPLFCCPNPIKLSCQVRCDLGFAPRWFTIKALLGRNQGHTKNCWHLLKAYVIPPFLQTSFCALSLSITHIHTHNTFCLPFPSLSYLLAPSLLLFTLSPSLGLISFIVLIIQSQFCLAVILFVPSHLDEKTPASN